MAAMPEPTKNLLATVLELSASLETLAALGAHLRTEDEGLAPDPRVRAKLAEVVALLGAPEATAAERPMVIGAIRSILRQALDWVEQPERPCAWGYDDPVVLNATGKGSIAVANAIALVANDLGDLGQRFAGSGGSFLDLGTGSAWLAIAMANHFPALHVVGVDRFPPALAIARKNVAGANLAERIEIVDGDVSDLAFEARFDGVWVPGPFLSQEAVAAVLPRLRSALRPGGWVFFGLFAGPPGPLPVALAELRTLRSGGHPWTAEAASTALTQAGYSEARELARTWAGPLRLVVARSA